MCPIGDKLVTGSQLLETPTFTLVRKNKKYDIVSFGHLSEVCEKLPLYIPTFPNVAILNPLVWRIAKLGKSNLSPECQEVTPGSLEPYPELRKIDGDERLSYKFYYYY